MEDGLGDVAEGAGLFGGEAMLREGVEDAGHDPANVLGRGEIAGSVDEFHGESVGVGWRAGWGVMFAEAEAGQGGVTTGLSGAGFVGAAGAGNG